MENLLNSSHVDGTDEYCSMNEQTIIDCDDDEDVLDANTNDGEEKDEDNLMDEEDDGEIEVEVSM